MSRAELTQDRLKELLTYNPESGEFHWNSAHACRSKRKSLKAGSTNRNGYSSVYVDGRPYQIHRLAWLYMTGERPVEIDHINHQKSDNRGANLAASTRRQNCRNLSLRRTSTSGVTGVNFNRKTQLWEAWIGVDGARIYLGSSVGKSGAIAMRKDAEVAHGFHPNHGQTKEALL